MASPRGTPWTALAIVVVATLAARLVAGYLRFCLLCSVGLAGNVAVGSVLHGHGVPWGLAGLAGAGCGAVWNYVSTSLAVW